MSSIEDLKLRLIEKQQDVDRIERIVERRRSELESEACAIQDLEIILGTSMVPQLRELGREVAPEDFLDMVNRLENKLKLQQMRTQAVNKEVMEAKLLNKQTEDLIQQLDDEVHRIKAVTGYVDPQHSTGRSNHICSKLTTPEQEFLTQELRMLVTRVKDEERVTKDIITQKDKLIEQLSNNDKEMKDKEEVVYELRNKMNVRNNELRKINEEYETYRKEHLHADKVISRLENQNDNSCIASLMQDKLFLKAKIYEHVDMRRAQDKAVKAQSFRLNHLQERADMITNAVADLKLTELVSSKLKGTVAPVEEPVCSLDIESILPVDETVDISLYELLCRDIEAINNSIGLKDIILLEKQATIEALEEKVERVAMMNEEDMAIMNEDVARLEYEVRNLNQVCVLDGERVWLRRVRGGSRSILKQQEVWNDREMYQQEIASLRKLKTAAQKNVFSVRNLKKKTPSKTSHPNGKRMSKQP